MFIHGLTKMPACKESKYAVQISYGKSKKNEFESQRKAQILITRAKYIKLNQLKLTLNSYIKQAGTSLR